MKQRGNVLPYILAMITALMLAGQYVFNAYKVSNESSRLQNTTDAAAYSVGTVYAQNYNFVALSNRSLVANQITMAQVVTMISWTRMLVTLAETANDIGQYIPYVSVVTGYIDQVAQIVSQIVEGIAPVVTNVIAAYTNGISALQQLAVPGTALIAQEILEEVIEANDADVSYSLATIAVIGGSVSHLSNLYGQSDCRGEADRVRDSGSGAGNAETIARCRQFRNVTLASRDGFTASRTYRFSFPGMPASIYLPGIAAVSVPGVALYSTMSIERAGGTTMGGDTPGVQNSTPFTTWTAIDTVSIHASTTYATFSGVSTTDYRERVKLGTGHAYVGHECSRCHHIAHEGSNYWNVNPKGSSCTDEDYADTSRPLNDGAFVLMDVLALNCTDLADRFGDDISNGASVGLTPFYNLRSEGYIEKKDHIMIYLRKDQNDVATVSQTMGGGSDSYRLDRFEGAQNDVIHGSAGAAVFFRRGNDRWMLDTGRRVDNRVEFGNTYNPFWESRLDKLSTAERLSLEVIKEL